MTDQDRQAYRQELTRIQSVGYAVSKDELIQGAVAVAAPFFTGGSKVMGSLVVYGPSARVDESRIEKIVALLLEESSELSKTFGL